MTSAVPGAPRRVGVLLFPGFELLDVFGPVELMSRLRDRVAIEYLAPEPGLVRSNQGAEILATTALATAATPDVALVPGGLGTRRLIDDERFLGELAAWARPAAVVASVCTGSALLARAGLLEGYRATSNKRAFDWASGFGDDVRWEPRARWVHDRDRWTSSGVAAGMDMAAALIAHLEGPDAARRAAWEIELEVQADPDRDPFAV